MIPEIGNHFENLLKEGNTFVLMKTSRNTKELEEIIQKNKAVKKEITSVQNCTMENEIIIIIIIIIDGFSKSENYLTKYNCETKK